MRQTIFTILLIAVMLMLQNGVRAQFGPHNPHWPRHTLKGWGWCPDECKIVWNTMAQVYYCNCP